ncbi:DUF202 domain-containing protein [Vibrio hannami]|uniref:YidH family protein n=1 Tax=Vibrio hannami TaxID=2717094 RepID=UPI00241090A9|nr:DUF202 domain-containing protein [Vibrio hannami]MDG3085356.1 DUF202 domain-containing protein [Vibrio hannami]
MKLRIKNRDSNWRHQGKAPDYRFSLANERTYLAWMRTAIALLAGAIAIDQLTPDLADPLIRIFLSIFLCLCSGLLSFFAYKRWSINEQAMRHEKELPYTSFIKLVSAFLIFLTASVILAIAL